MLHKFTHEELSRGGNKSSGKFIKNSIKAKECGKKGHEKLIQNNPNLNILAGKNSRIYENKTAKQIQANKIYLPNEICDRIIIRDGKIIFIEIKHPNEKLRPKQAEFQQIAKDQYEILYGN